MGIKCCKGCVPPKRTPTCHSTCEDYLREKAEWEEEKKAIKAHIAQTPRITPYDYDEINYIGCKRHKRRSRD